MSDFLKLMARNAEHRAHMIEEPADFCGIFNKASPAIIAEIKFSGPTHPNLYSGELSVVEIAKRYVDSGADAISILTEPDYFSGQVEFIAQVHQQFPVTPLLMKDFIVDEKQIVQAKSLGASAVLLIVDLIDTKKLRELNQLTLDLRMTPVIEVHQHVQLEIALKLNPKIILINQRDLTDLSVDYVTSRELITLIPRDIHAICASGIESTAQIAELTALGFSGFLIGSWLMRHDDPGAALKKLR